MKIIIAALVAAGLSTSISATSAVAKDNGDTGHPTTIHPSEAVKNSLSQTLKNGGGGLTVTGGEGPLHGGSQPRPDPNGPRN